MAAIVSETASILDSVFEGTLGVSLPECLQFQQYSFSSEFLRVNKTHLRLGLKYS